jgi:PTS system mannose-specific IIA component
MAKNGQTGIIVVVHGEYGGPLLRAAEAIVGGPLGVALVEAPPSAEVEVLRQRISDALGDVDGGQGALVLVDLCGSTPANLCQQAVELHPGSEILTGLSLPMLVKLATCDRREPAAELAGKLRESSHRSVQIGSDLLRKG